MLGLIQRLFKSSPDREHRWLQKRYNKIFVKNKGKIYIYILKKSLNNKTEGQRLNFYKSKTLPAIDDSVNVKHGYNLEDESLPQMTCSVEVAH